MRSSTYVKTPGSDSVSSQLLESSSDMVALSGNVKWNKTFNFDASQPRDKFVWRRL